MAVYACICVYMRVYVLYMRVYVLYMRLRAPRRQGRGESAPTLQNDENSNLDNKNVYSYALLGGGEIFWNRMAVEGCTWA